MKSVLKYLFQSENGGDIVTFLRNRGPQAHVIAPAWVREHVFGSDMAQQKAVWSERVPDFSAGEAGKANFIVVAEDAEAERAIEASLRSRKGVAVYGLFGHVVPAMLCGAKGMATGRPTGALKRYAILCVPRSGSRYFSAVLSNRGVGAPKEHIREPMAHIIAEGRLGFRRAIETLERFGQKNEIFGTKLISTFLIRASRFKMPELTDNIGWMVARGYHLVSLERSLKETAISSYIAFLMRQWHFFGELNEDARTKLDSLVFEDGAAWDEYLRFRSEKVILDAIARDFQIPVIEYAQIESGADTVVQGLCGIIGANPDKLAPGSAPVPVATRTESPIYGTFADRLDALLDRRAPDIDAATVKKIRALTALGQAGAEALVAGHVSTWQ